MPDMTPTNNAVNAAQPVPLALEVLDSQISVAESMVNDLEKRLHPVLRPGKPNDPDERPLSRDESDGPLVSVVFSMSSRIVRLNDRLGELHMRLTV